MNILSIDLGATIGYIKNGVGGSVKFKTKDDSIGYRLLLFKNWLTSMTKDIDLITYEVPVEGHFSGTKSHANFEGVLLAFCHENNITYKGYNNSSIKNYAKKTYEAMTNDKHKGHMKKEHMVSYSNICFDLNPEDDNHADAWWIYLLTLENI